MWSALAVVAAALVLGIIVVMRTKEWRWLFGAMAMAYVLVALAAATHAARRADLTTGRRLAWVALAIFLFPGLPLGGLAYLWNSSRSPTPN